ncbi:MAG TPA: DNA mismatch repair protein MutS [Vampirovibrionales bacterium]
MTKTNFSFPPSDSYTPIVKQFLELRRQAGDAILLFRLGDFYECLFSDANILAQELEIALTARPDSGHPEGKIPMAGIPVKTAQAYISKLLLAGYKVAMCEQVTSSDDAKTSSKGPMKRELVRVLTPGTLLETEFLEADKANYLGAIYPQSKKGKETMWGFAFTDVSTGELKVTELAESQLCLELYKLKPSELLVPTTRIKDPEGIYLENNLLPNGIKEKDFNITGRNGSTLDLDTCKRKIAERFGAHALSGFGCDNLEYGLQAIAFILEYLEYACTESLNGLTKIKKYECNDFVKIDEQTIRNLELFETQRNKTKKGSLLGLLAKDLSTKMGSRLMKEWISYPLINVAEIKKRQRAIASLIKLPGLHYNLKDLLKHIADLSRLTVKLTNSRLNPRELGQLKNSLLTVPGIQVLLQEVVNKHEEFEEEEDNLLQLTIGPDLLLKAKELDLALGDELPVVSGEGNIFKLGFSEKLDEMKNLLLENEKWLKDFEETERERVGCKSLKVTFNKAAGFYIELTKANKHLAPENYQIKQNLTNINRYITPELKDYESRYLLAEANCKNLEQELFLYLRDSLKGFADELQALNEQLATVDCLLSLACLAYTNSYICPEINYSNTFEFEEGRHPVIEQDLPSGYFVSNDLCLEASGDKNQVVILTGPNMSGKSTFMKQAAIICLLSQIGSFVPAKNASIGLVDRIFTRIGASDDLSQGQSTFMVEMTETAYLLNNMTEKSLILLDEIGRGTSTFDGVAIAWSVVEYIANKGARTIFATHYHELNGLADLFKQVVNFQVSVHEGEELVFLHKVVPGGADRSYGIEVARMAGLPREVLARSKGIMSQMSSKNLSIKKTQTVKECSEQAKLELEI